MRRRVIIRLRQRGWLLKQIGAVWGISPTRVHHVIYGRQRIGTRGQYRKIFLPKFIFSPQVAVESSVA